MRMDTKKLTTLAILSAIAYVVMVVGRIPISPLPFLKYDPKDIVIAIGGMIYGPFSAMLMSMVVSVVEMLTVSESGLIGLAMNVLSTCAFACTAAFIYKKRQSMSGAVIGLLAGVATAVVIMLLWNYFLTPLYQGTPREAVAAILIPLILPFNLIKYGINATLTMLLYKPLVLTLRRLHFIPESSGKGGKLNFGVIFISLLILASCILAVLIMLEKI